MGFLFWAMVELPTWCFSSKYSEMGGGGLVGQSEVGHDEPLDLEEGLSEGGSGSDGSRHLSGAGPGHDLVEPLPVPEHLGDVSRDLESVGDGDGELGVGPADLQGVPLLLRELGEGVEEGVDVLGDELEGLLDLEGGGGVDDVVGGGSQVHVLAGGSLALLGHGLDHGHEVVVGELLDLLDSLNFD